MSMIESETKTGISRQVGNYNLTPLTQVLKVQTPGHHARFIWNRPKAIIVRTSEGQEQVLPVIDVTRISIWAMLAGGLLGAILVRVFFWNR